MNPYTVAHWKMNDNAASTTVLDATGNYNGTAQQNTSTLTTTGKINSALTFDGANDYVDTNDYFQSTFQDDFSISLWAKYDSGIIGNGDYIFTFGSFNDNSRVVLFHLGLEEGLDINCKLGGEFRSNANVVNVTTDDTVMVAGAWYHIVMTVKDNGIGTVTVNLYLNSTLQGTTTASCWTSDYSSAKNPCIGCYHHDDDFINLFDGIIDDVRIVNKVLSTDEINWLYNNGNGRESVGEHEFFYGGGWSW